MLIFMCYKGRGKIYLSYDIHRICVLVFPRGSDGSPPATLFLRSRPSRDFYPRLGSRAHCPAFAVAADPEARSGAGRAALRSPAPLSQADGVRQGLPAEGGTYPSRVAGS